MTTYGREVQATPATCPGCGAESERSRKQAPLTKWCRDCISGEIATVTKATVAPVVAAVVNDSDEWWTFVPLAGEVERRLFPRPESQPAGWLSGPSGSVPQLVWEKILRTVKIAANGLAKDGAIIKIPANDRRPEGAKDWTGPWFGSVAARTKTDAAAKVISDEREAFDARKNTLQALLDRLHIDADVRIRRYRQGPEVSVVFNDLEAIDRLYDLITDAGTENSSAV